MPRRTTVQSSTVSKSTQPLNSLCLPASAPESSISKAQHHCRTRSFSRPQELHMTINRLAIPTRRAGACAQAIIVASALSLWSMPALAQARPERLSDQQVKTLIDQVDEGRDKFEGNLESTFKSSTLRGPRGETKVEG